MLPKVWSSLWKVKIAAEGMPVFEMSDEFLETSLLERRVLTGVDLDVDLVLAGAEEDGLVSGMQKSVYWYM